MKQKLFFDIDYLVKEYLGGRDLYSLAEEFKCTAETIRKHLKPLNIIRKRGVIPMPREEFKRRQLENAKRYVKTPQGKENAKKNKLKWPEKQKARAKVRTNIDAGRMPNANTLICMDCGNRAREYDHYLGYEEAHWLDVQPVCSSCNKKREKNRRDAKK